VSVVFLENVRGTGERAGSRSLKLRQYVVEAFAHLQTSEAIGRLCVDSSSEARYPQEGRRPNAGRWFEGLGTGGVG
jgi:hypothetical protein